VVQCPANPFLCWPHCSFDISLALELKAECDNDMRGEEYNNRLHQSRGAYLEPALPARQSRRPKTASRGPFYSLLPSRLGRGPFLKWLRRTHAWLGLWGAALGILFGVTGILNNHRAIMKIPAAKIEQNVIQLPLPQPPPTSPEVFAAWLQWELGIKKPWTLAKAEPPRAVIWGRQELQQPEHWVVNFGAPHRLIGAEYWVGNSFVTVKRRDANFWAFLIGLHMANGASVAWILLADSIAGSFVVLALSGVLLWTRLHGPRLLAAGLSLGSLLMGIWFAWSSM